MGPWLAQFACFGATCALGGFIPFSAEANSSVCEGVEYSGTRCEARHLDRMMKIELKHTEAAETPDKIQ